MAHLRFTDVHVRYPVYGTGRQRSILGLAAHKASFGKVARDVGEITVVDALNGVSINLQEGDRLALIGRNGSGKTTLLKVCAGLILPDAGSVDISGSRASILHPLAALDRESTGLENIHRVARLMGVRRQERDDLAEEIAEFTELGEFLTLPVRTYSAGMTIRLAFALVTSFKREVVAIDEVIGAGDALFVEKAAKRVSEMFERAKVLILATHAGHIASKLCNKAAWLDAGRVVMTGEPAAVWDAYLNQRKPHEVEAAA